MVCHLLRARNMSQDHLQFSAELSDNSTGLLALSSVRPCGQQRWRSRTSSCRPSPCLAFFVAQSQYTIDAARFCTFLTWVDNKSRASAGSCDSEFDRSTGIQHSPEPKPYPHSCRPALHTSQHTCLAHNRYEQTTCQAAARFVKSGLDTKATRSGEGRLVGHTRYGLERSVGLPSYSNGRFTARRCCNCADLARCSRVHMPGRPALEQYL